MSVNMLTQFLNYLSILKYTIDAAWFGLFVLMVSNRIKWKLQEVYPLLFVIILFLLFSLFGFILNYQSPFYYLWGLRNNIRYFIFFFSCIAVLRVDYIENYLNVLDKVFWFNFPLVLFQYFILQKNGDYLGGIFGIEKGCNSYMNIFLLIILTRSVLQYLHKQEKLTLFLIKCVITLIIAIFSELKIVFIEILFLVGMVFIMIRMSGRKMLITVVVSIVVFIGAQLLVKVFAYFEGWFTIENIIKTITSKEGYTSGNDMNRLTAVPIILERYLTEPMEMLLGLGLGNCDHATFSFLDTPFSQMHKSMHYTWFSSAFMLLETGIVGLCLYVLFFIMVFYMSQKKGKKQGSNILYCQMAQIMALMSLIMIIYNSSMRTEAGYMMFFILSLPFVQGNSQKGGLLT